MRYSQGCACPWLKYIYFQTFVSFVGVKVVWDGDSYAEISVDPKFKGSTCGLCGNYNGNVDDEFTTKRGRLVEDRDKFGKCPYNQRWIVTVSYQSYLSVHCNTTTVSQFTDCPVSYQLYHSVCCNTTLVSQFTDCPVSYQSFHSVHCNTTLVSEFTDFSVINF